MSGKSSGLGDQLYVGGYDLGGDINSLGNIHGGNSPLPSTDITQSAMDRMGGLRDGGLDFTAYHNVDTDRAHARFSSLPTADVIATYAHGSAIGNACASCVAKQVNYDPQRGQDGSLLFGVNLQANAYGLEWGVQATAGKRTDTTATTGAALDLLAAGAGAFGLQMYVHLFSFTGTSVTIKLQSSSDDGAGDAYSDVTGATTGALTAVGAVRVATAAISIERYLKVVTTGTFSNAVFMVHVTRNDTAVVF